MPRRCVYHNHPRHSTYLRAKALAGETSHIYYCRICFGYHLLLGHHDSLSPESQRSYQETEWASRNEKIFICFDEPSQCRRTFRSEAGFALHAREVHPLWH